MVSGCGVVVGLFRAGGGVGVSDGFVEYVGGEVVFGDYQIGVAQGIFPFEVSGCDLSDCPSDVSVFESVVSAAEWPDVADTGGALWPLDGVVAVCSFGGEVAFGEDAAGVTGLDVVDHGSWGPVGGGVQADGV